MVANYYEILRIPKTANDKQIRDAFRKLARKYHPDLNPDDEKTEKRFKQVNEAYEVLSNSINRKKYDKYGSLRDLYSIYNTPEKINEFKIELGNLKHGKSNLKIGMKMPLLQIKTQNGFLVLMVYLKIVTSIELIKTVKNYLK